MSRVVRIGHGIDAHRFAVDRPLVLGGVKIPFPLGLDGHSDGDAVCHALADALLGPAGFGDIGRHFPSGEERWKGVNSTRILAKSARLLKDGGWTVDSAQVVAVLERPMIAPWVEKMEHNLASALGIDISAITVSATTSDGMGFMGKGEGVWVSAVALISREPNGT